MRTTSRLFIMALVHCRDVARHLVKPLWQAMRTMVLYAQVVE